MVQKLPLAVAGLSKSTQVHNMITLELTEEQAKLLLIITGSCAGALGSLGVYDMVRSKLRVIGETPDPIFRAKHETIVITSGMLERIRTM